MTHLNIHKRLLQGAVPQHPSPNMTYFRISLTWPARSENAISRGARGQRSLKLESAGSQCEGRFILGRVRTPAEGPNLCHLLARKSMHSAPSKGIFELTGRDTSSRPSFGTRPGHTAVNHRLHLNTTNASRSQHRIGQFGPTLFSTRPTQCNQP